MNNLTGMPRFMKRGLSVKRSRQTQEFVLQVMVWLESTELFLFATPTPKKEQTNLRRALECETQTQIYDLDYLEPVSPAN